MFWKEDTVLIIDIFFCHEKLTCEFFLLVLSLQKTGRVCNLRAEFANGVGRMKSDG